MIRINEYIKVLENLNITQSDFIYLYCTYAKKKSVLQRYSNLFPTDDGTEIGQRNIDLLVEKGLLKLNKSNNYATTDKFNKYYVSIDGAFEIFEMYPTELKTLNKHQFRIRYNEEIVFNLSKHKSIKQSVNYALKNKIELPNIEMFLITQYWNTIIKIKKNSQK